MALFKSDEAVVKDLFATADIEVGGAREWDIQVSDKRVFHRILSQANLGLGEAYMDRWWNVKNLGKFFEHIFSANLGLKIWKYPRVLFYGGPRFIFYYFLGLVFNFQKHGRAFNIGKDHYDTGVELFEPMLGRSMAYTCAHWGKGVKTLDEAQTAKYKLIGDKLNLKPGMSVLDIGSGFGTLATYLAREYGVSVVGITVSSEQKEWSENCAKGLKVEFRLQDYRDVYDGPFDRVVSVGMFEHVGPKNYREYMKATHRLLTKGGLFLLHTIGSDRSLYRTDPWNNKYIFPNGVLPSQAQIFKAAENLFVHEHTQNIGPHYTPTLEAWRKNFLEAWNDLKKVEKKDGTQKYDERFKRMWEYYLTITAESFRAREIQLWQILFSKGGVRGGATWVKS